MTWTTGPPRYRQRLQDRRVQERERKRRHAQALVSTTTVRTVKANCERRHVYRRLWRSTPQPRKVMEDRYLRALEVAADAFIATATVLVFAVDQQRRRQRLNDSSSSSKSCSLVRQDRDRRSGVAAACSNGTSSRAI